MKKIISLQLLLLNFIAVVAQEIPSYYSDVNLSLTGMNLKDELAVKISSTHTTILSYTPDVWNALKEADKDASNNSKVVLIYGWNDSDTDITNDKTRNKDQHGSGSGVWNREHVYSKSLATPNLGTIGAGADAHNLRPADAQRNSRRNNRKFAAGSGTASYITANGYWYPGDEWKGDVARMMLYMYLRYGNQCLPKNVGVGTTTISDSNMIDLFLEWNAEDPVSNLEKQRNPVLEQWQGNRNPFIDNPAFATQIWGGPQAENLFNANSASTTTNDLFISEYVEGLSYNKAIEIANFTGSTINLANYSLKKAINGSNSWSTAPLQLYGTLAHGDVFVIANSKSNTIIINEADITTSSTVFTFNGNDAIGLFKNNTLIDIVGNPNSNTYFGYNVTLQRKNNISSPNTSYFESEWETISANTLGQHNLKSSSTTTPLNYCVSKSNNSSYEYIDFVGIGGVENTTASNNGYGNFTNLTANVNYGANTIIISAGFFNEAYTEFWKVWIDYNQNGTFENNELVVDGSSSSAEKLTANFSIPTTAKNGTTRMRVSMKWESAQTACETFDYGEVEDYTINIGNTNFRQVQNNTYAYGTLGKESPIFKASLYPNPARNFVNIAVADGRNISYTILNTLGKIIAQGNTYKNINISNLTTGVYLVKIKDKTKTITKKLFVK